MKILEFFKEEILKKKKWFQIILILKWDNIVMVDLYLVAKLVAFILNMCENFEKLFYFVCLKKLNYWTCLIKFKLKT